MNELKRAQIITDDLSLFPSAKRSCIEKLRLLQEANMRITGEGTSRAREEEDAEEAAGEEHEQEAEGSEEEVPVHQQSNTGWQSFREYYDTSTGAFQQNIHQTIVDSMGQFQQSFATSMDQYRQESLHCMGQFHTSMGEVCQEMGEVRQELGEVRQEMGSLRHDFGDFRQGVNNRMVALEQSWNNWTLFYPHPPPPPTPPFQDAEQ